MAELGDIMAGVGATIALCPKCADMPSTPACQIASLVVASQARPAG
jgi:hypothetical protein